LASAIHGRPWSSIHARSTGASPTTVGARTSPVGCPLTAATGTSPGHAPTSATRSTLSTDASTAVKATDVADELDEWERRCDTCLIKPKRPGGRECHACATGNGTAEHGRSTSSNGRRGRTTRGGDESSDQAGRVAPSSGMSDDASPFRLRYEQFIEGASPDERYWSVHTYPPATLYHYTTMSGFLGITRTRVLWASDVRYMNDASELVYAVEVINEATTDTFKEVGLGVLESVIRPTQQFAWVDEFPRDWYSFAVCFCEEGNLLSQWRGYGLVSGPGICLGFETVLMERPANAYLRRVIYDPDEQREHVATTVRRWLETAERVLDENPELTPEDVHLSPHSRLTRSGTFSSSTSSASNILPSRKSRNGGSSRPSR
jgi:hypothetical protein